MESNQFNHDIEGAIMRKLLFFYFSFPNHLQIFSPKITLIRIQIYTHVGGNDLIS